MAINFTKTLEFAKKTIFGEIKKKQQEHMMSVVNALPVVKEMNAIDAEIIQLTKTVDILKKKKNLLGTRCKNEGEASQVMHRSGLVASMINSSTYYVSDIPQEVIDELSEHLEDVEVTNISTFNEICERFDRMMALATGTKAQREILEQFYSIDWRSLGIDIPSDMDITNIAIKDGKIISDTKALAAPKQ